MRVTHKTDVTRTPCPRIESRGRCIPRIEILGCRGADCPPARAEKDPSAESFRARVGGQSSLRQPRISIRGNTAPEFNLRASLLPAFLLAALLAGLLAGCGGGGSSSRSVSQGALVRFSVKWPAAATPQARRPQFIPSGAQSVVVSVYRSVDYDKSGAAATPVVPPIVLARSAGTVANQPISGLPINVPLRFRFEARPNADGTGTTQSLAVTPAPPTAGLTLHAGDNGQLTPVTLGDAITRLTVSPAQLSLVVKAADLQISAIAQDADGSIVLTGPNTIDFQFVDANGSPDTTDPHASKIASLTLVSGQNLATVHALAPGTHNIRAVFSDQGTTLAGTATTLTVSSPGNLPGSNAIAYALNTTLTFGSWGQDEDTVPTFARPDSVAVITDPTSGARVIFASPDSTNGGGDAPYVKAFEQTGGPNTPPTYTDHVVGGPLFTADNALRVYVVPTGGSSIGVFPYSTGTHTFAATATATITAPGAITAIAVDGQSDVFFAVNGSVYESVASGGSYGSPVSLFSAGAAVSGLAVAADGSVFVVTPTAVSKYASSAGVYGKDTSFGTNGSVTQVSHPQRVAVDVRAKAATSGNVYVTDADANRIAQFDQFGDYLNDLSNPAVTDDQSNRGTAPTGVLRPLGVWVGADGIVWVAENGRDPVTGLDGTEVDYQNRIVPFSPQ